MVSTHVLRFAPLVMLALAAGCTAHESQHHDPGTPCGQMFERYLECGYDTDIPGLPEQQEPLLRIEAGDCDAALTCYAECMTDVDASEDTCWACEFTDMDCGDSPANECPDQCE